MIYFKKKTERVKKKEDTELDAELKDIKVQETETLRVEDMVEDYIKQAKGKLALQVLTEKGMGDAVKEFVDKEEKDAILELVHYQLDKTQVYLKKRSTAEDVIDDEVVRYKEERKKRKEDEQEVKEAMEIAKTKRETSDVTIDSDNDLDSNFGDVDTVPVTRGRGGRGSRGGRRGRGESGVTRGSRGGRGRGSKNKEPVVNDSQKSMMESFVSAGRSRATKGHRMSDSDDDAKAITISESDDSDPFNMPSSSRKKKAVKPPPCTRKEPAKKPVKRGGINFESDSDDEIPVPSRKRRR